MTLNTDDLIRGLAADMTRVRPLASPWRRAGVWLALSASYLVLLYVLWPHRPAAAAMDQRLAIEQIAAL